MLGVPLTRPEVVNIVTRKVRKFELVGLTHEDAILMAAHDLKVEPDRISALVSSTPTKPLS